jgi:TPR repeat protein
MNRPGRNGIGLLATATLALAASGQAFAETRIALVIGNSSYAHGGRLANPVNDAAMIAKVLTSIGFKVTTRTDLGREGMTQALEAFARDSRDADVSLVYYAGHGMEIAGANYLLPIDATLSADTDVEFEAVPVDRVMTAVGRARRLKVVVLDACRNNPYLDAMKRANGQRDIAVGLAKPVAASGMLIAYAAREGSTSADGAGDDSPYAVALARHLTETGVDVRILFGEVHDDVLKATGGRQEPSNYDSIGGQGFYLTAATGASGGEPSRGSALAVTNGPVAPDSRQMELAFWDKVDAKDPAQLQAYLAQYPNGAFSALARAKLAQPPAGPGASTTLQLAQVGAGAGSAGASAGAGGPATPGGAAQAEAAAIDAASKGEDAFRAHDYATALRLFRQAADQGLAAGAFRVGLLYANGQGVTQDYVEARRWYEKAVAKGYARAMNTMGNLYRFGRGVPQDYALAVKWYTEAAAKGSDAAQVNLGSMYWHGYGVAKDDAAALRWYRLAAAQENPVAQFDVGVFYREGRAVPQDFAEAARWFRLSANQNTPEAQYALGLLYSNGRGVPPDPAQARALIAKAAEGGNDLAKGWMAQHPG